MVHQISTILNWGALAPKRRSKGRKTIGKSWEGLRQTPVENYCNEYDVAKQRKTKGKEGDLFGSRKGRKQTKETGTVGVYALRGGNQKKGLGKREPENSVKHFDRGGRNVVPVQRKTEKGGSCRPPPETCCRRNRRQRQRLRPLTNRGQSSYWKKRGWAVEKEGKTKNTAERK